MHASERRPTEKGLAWESHVDTHDIAALDKRWEFSLF